MSKCSDQTLSFIAPPAPEGRPRLDKFLSSQTQILSRTRLKSLIESGNVIVAGEKVTEPSHRVNSGVEILVVIPPARPASPIAQDMSLDVVYEDVDLIVINKPAGLVVHPAPGNPDKTLVNALIAHCGNSLSGIGGETRPGIVHRLDKGTSGLLVVAKNDLAHRHLAKQFADHSLRRAYLALVWRSIAQKSGTIEGAIGRNPRNRKKMTIVTNGGKPAITHFSRRRKLGDWASLVECRLETGRTHQIRVHMASIGHAIVGDLIYGGGTTKFARQSAPAFCEKVLKLNRQALHAYELGFTHPSSGERVLFKADLPPDIQCLL